MYYYYKTHLTKKHKTDDNKKNASEKKASASSGPVDYSGNTPSDNKPVSTLWSLIKEYRKMDIGPCKLRIYGVYTLCSSLIKEH
jgi:hypothetical protein